MISDKYLKYENPIKLSSPCLLHLLNIRIVKFLVFSIFLTFFSSVEAKTYTILLWNGENIKGSVVSMGMHKLTIKKEDGLTEEISKKDIIKIIMEDISNTEIEKIRQEALKKKEEKEKQTGDSNSQITVKDKKEKENIKTLEKPKNISYYIYSPNSKNISLASSNAECSQLKEIKQWYILFGSVPINEIKTDEIFSDSGQYRVYAKATLADSIISVVFGLTTSFTRKTIFIESCKTEDKIILQKK